MAGLRGPAGGLAPMLPLPLISLLLGLLVLTSGAGPSWAVTLNVPCTQAPCAEDERPTIQIAVTEADSGDEIVIAPGIYTENVVITGKSLTLRSTGGDPADTVIESPQVGPVGDVFDVRASSPETGTLAPHVTFVGLTVANGDSGVLIRPNVLVEFLDGRVIGNSDGIELEGQHEAEKNIARAIVKRSLIALNRDDGVDSDRKSELWIEDSTIQDNHDDGIEIRLQNDDDFDGASVAHVILRNRFLHNGRAGLQLIDHTDPEQPDVPVLTPRSFRVERNLFAENGHAGLGMMCDGESLENFEGCPELTEPVRLVHNTFVGNGGGVPPPVLGGGLSGGVNVVGVNNLFVGNVNFGVRNVAGSSHLAHSLFHGNVQDQEGSNLELPTTLFEDPLLTPEHTLSDASPAVDAGTAFFEWGGETLVDANPCDYSGLAPDLGAFELDTGPAMTVVPSVLDMSLGAGSDDALEKGGKVKTGGKRLDLGSKKGGVAGLRFDGLAIDPGAEIVTAHLQLKAAKKGMKPASLRIRGEASDDTAPLAETPKGLSARAKTTASVAWSPPAWPEKGAASATPDLAAVVQEIVDRPGWASGNAIAFFITGTGKRSVAAREGGGNALLHVEFTTSVPACAP